MQRHDKTSMGGPNERFEATRWTDILGARTDDDARRRQVLETILARYWKPVYCYLRRKGCGNEDAKDLTQGFFHEIVLGRGLLQQADRAKGRFRTFLLTALDRYATDVHRAATARKRRPEGGLVSLEGSDTAHVPEPAFEATPEEAFHYAWASALLDQVLTEVRDACQRGGKAVHWEVFRATVLAPIMEGVAARPLADLCAQHGIADERRASNMIVTVKRRFQDALRRHVRQCVESEEEVEEEIRDLMEILSQSRAGP